MFNFEGYDEVKFSSTLFNIERILDVQRKEIREIIELVLKVFERPIGIQARSLPEKISVEQKNDTSILIMYNGQKYLVTLSICRRDDDAIMRDTFYLKIEFYRTTMLIDEKTGEYVENYVKHQAHYII